MCRNVLVVEDDNAIRDSIVQALALLGYNASSAENGQEALDYLAQQKDLPCVILLDLMMPVVDGWEFRAKQQANPKLANIPVVIISADGQIIQKANQMGIGSSLKKPINLMDLRQSVLEFCGEGMSSSP